MATQYVALLRGINVGGNNIIPMAGLRECFADAGASDVATYIQSGNVLFDGGRRSRKAWSARIERGLAGRFGYDGTVVLRSHAELRAVVTNAPRGFGSEPELYRYDVIFLKEPLGATEAMAEIRTREGVDVATAGVGVVYSSRLIERVTQSQLGKIVGLPIYKKMTIRNWRTTSTLLAKMDERAG